MPLHDREGFRRKYDQCVTNAVELALSLGVPCNDAEPIRDDETLPARDYIGFPYRGPADAPSLLVGVGNPSDAR